MVLQSLKETFAEILWPEHPKGLQTCGCFFRRYLYKLSINVPQKITGIQTHAYIAVSFSILNVKILILQLLMPEQVLTDSSGVFTLESTRVDLSMCSRLQELKITFRDIQSLGSSHKGN